MFLCRFKRTSPEASGGRAVECHVGSQRGGAEPRATEPSSPDRATLTRLSHLEALMRPYSLQVSFDSLGDLGLAKQEPPITVRTPRPEPGRTHFQPTPYTSNAKPQTLYPQPWTLSPEPETWTSPATSGARAVEGHAGSQRGGRDLAEPRCLGAKRARDGASEGQ